MGTLKRRTKAAHAALAKEELRARQEEQLCLVLFIIQGKFVHLYKNIFSQVFIYYKSGHTSDLCESPQS